MTDEQQDPNEAQFQDSETPPESSEVVESVQDVVGAAADLAQATVQPIDFMSTHNL